MTIHRSLRYAAILILSIVPMATFAHAQSAAPNGSLNPRVEAVWKREELYWRLVKAGNVDNYRALWDDGFRGWPCKPQHTATKAKITDWFAISGTREPKSLTRLLVRVLPTLVTSSLSTTRHP